MLRNHRIQTRGCDDLLLLGANDVELLASAAQCLKEAAKESLACCRGIVFKKSKGYVSGFSVTKSRNHRSMYWITKAIASVLNYKYPLYG